jgi:hypothetical protein
VTKQITPLNAFFFLFFFFHIKKSCLWVSLSIDHCLTNSYVPNVAIIGMFGK